jgi:hypothetical protein
VAIGAVKLQLVTSGRWTVTAEVASSSLVVPAISFNHLQQTQKKNLGPFGSNKPESTPPATHSLEQLLERALEHHLLNER